MIKVLTSGLLQFGVACTDFGCVITRTRQHCDDDDIFSQHDDATLRICTSSENYWTWIFLWSGLSVSDGLRMASTITWLHETPMVLFFWGFVKSSSSSECQWTLCRLLMHLMWLTAKMNHFKRCIATSKKNRWLCYWPTIRSTTYLVPAVLISSSQL